MDAAELRSLALAAIREGKDKRKMNEEAEQIRKYRENQEQNSRAQGIIRTIPDLCKKAAEQGLTKVKVLRLNHDDCHYVGTIGMGSVDGPHYDGYEVCSPAIKIVEQFCSDAGFKPSFEKWWGDEYAGLDLWINI